MKQDLHELLTRFARGEAIPPLVLDDGLLLDSINFLRKTEIFDMNVLRTEYIPDTYLFSSGDESFKIEQARDIIEKSSVRSGGDNSIFIIEGIDRLTLAAANSLLKIFEDIPDRTLFLLTSSSERDKMLETLASRVIFLSHNLRTYSLPGEIRDRVDRFFSGRNAMELLSFLALAKLDSNEYLALLIYLKDKALQGYIQKPETIQKIEDGIATISSTNANPRWVVDGVVLSL